MATNKIPTPIQSQEAGQDDGQHLGILEWAIWYSDGSIFTSQDGPPELAPVFGVLVIVLNDPFLGWNTQSGSDYYGWDDRGDGPKWWGILSDLALASYLAKPGWKRVLIGESIPSETFSQVFEEIRNHPQWGQKSGFRRRENRP